MKRSAIAQWLGTGKEGSGTVSTQSQSLNKTQYSYKSRFEEGTGTNPEELIAAAHAGCFSMKLSFLIGAAGLTPGSIETTCDIVLDNGKITSSVLTTTVKAEGLTNDKLQEIAADAKENCPISKLLNTDISMTATLAV
ncbi:MAG: OsmC family peroxiredoxin [Bacteroidia bacterium]